MPSVISIGIYRFDRLVLVFDGNLTFGAFLGTLFLGGLMIEPTVPVPHEIPRDGSC